jgi:hypothetical protein
MMMHCAVQGENDFKKGVNQHFHYMYMQIQGAFLPKFPQ